MRIVLRLLFLLATAMGLAALLLWCGYLLSPDPAAPPRPGLPEASAAAMQALREPLLNPGNPPVFWRDVDYAAGPGAAWFPKGEPSFMAGLVAKGELPQVAERVGTEPLVVAGPDGTGRYGGSWLRVYTGGEIDYVVRAYMGGSTLVRWSPEGYPIVPNVAKSWEASPDQREWTFHLRRGMRWSDGQPFTADDILYFFNDLYPVWRTGQTPDLLMHRGKTGTVGRAGEKAVRFSFPDPYPLFLEKLAREPTVYAPKHYLQAYVPAPGQDPASMPALQAAIRSTHLNSIPTLIDFLIHSQNPEHPQIWPWIFRSFSATSPKTMVRNPYYWAVDEAGNQLPYINEVVFQNHSLQMVPSVAASGGISFQFRNISFKDYTLLMTDRGGSNAYRVLHWYPGERSAYTLFPNLNRQLNPDDPGSAAKAALLADRRFRQALSLAIDRPAIIKAQYKGVGTPSQLAPGSASAFHHPGLQEAFVGHDPQRANRLLDDIGLTRRDGDGFRVAPDGRYLAFFILFDNQIGRGPVDLIVSDWAKVGIRAMPRERFSNLLINERDAGYPDFFVWSGAGEVVPMVEPRSFVPVSNQSYQFSGYGRWFSLGGFYGDPRAAGKEGAIAPPAGSPAHAAMELYEEAKQTADPERRRELVRRILDINAEEIWSISICTPPPVIVVVDKDLRNVPEVAVQSYVFLSPNNVAKEAFFFGSDVFPSGKPRESAEKLEQLARAMVVVTPHPELAGGLAGPAGGGGGWLQRLLAALMLLVALASIVLAAVRHPYIGKRLLIMLPTLGVISVVVFTLIQLPPGDYIETYISKLEAEGEITSYERIVKLREMFWLDQPMAVRYLRWMGMKWFVTLDPADKGLLQGDLGRSMETQRKVASQVGDRILLTVLISLGTILFTWSLAIPIGIYSAVRQYSIGDYIFTFLGFIGMCVPGFLMALFLSYFAKVMFGIQMTGLLSPEFASAPGWPLPKVLDLLRHIWVPIVVMGISGTAGMIRVMRGNLLDELKKPYVVTARAKGVRPFKLLMKYPVRLALNPFISTIGGLFPQLVSGGAIVAVVLSLPTVGPQLLESLLLEDMYFAGSMLMVLSLLGVLGTLVSDLALLALDPRIRFDNPSR